MHHGTPIKLIADRCAAVFGNMNKKGPGFPDALNTVQAFFSEWEMEPEFCGALVDVIELFDMKEPAEKRLGKAIRRRSRALFF
ncbi:hypothetical protein Gbfr_007_142 [Gluconobacter frateurii M-2]|nr:hypothetical protein Gbfr_007_142 [Gluconobacter frateurii M-2]